VTLSQQAKTIWAKSERGNTTPSAAWHPLIAHMLDVAACAEAILEREPESSRKMYIQDLGFETWTQTKPWLIALVGMHDLGKASPSFQNLWRAGADRLEQTGLRLYGGPDRSLPGPSGKKYAQIDGVHHGYVSQLALQELLQGNGFSAQLAKDLGSAVGSHHGLRASETVLRKCWNSNGIGSDSSWKQVRKELFEAVLKTLDVNTDLHSGVQWLSAGAFIRLAGLTSFTDWIGSSLAFFDFTPDIAQSDLNVPALKIYYAERLTKAKQALNGIGWHPRQPLCTDTLDFKKIFRFAPRPLQQAVAQICQTLTAPSLLLIEAPMGEGKTEASLYTHLALQQQLGHRGLYLALPTQATGNAMFERLLTFLEQNSTQEKMLDLQLAHGAALLNSSFQKLKQQQIYDREESSEVRASIQAGEWFSHKKRALLSEYGVGTVDQALIGILHVRHYFVRLWGLGNRTIILDEVHAYDTYTSCLIENLLEWLHSLGASVIIMSATLPAKARHKFLQAYGYTGSPDTSAAYPRVSCVTQSQLCSSTFAANKSFQLHLQALPSAIEVVGQKLIELAEMGGCIACIVNTVGRAQALYQWLEQQSPEAELFLFHARYPAGERRQIETDMLNKFGKKTENGQEVQNPQRPLNAILIATQVVEQSLDLDFDAMVSDLAPIDLLLQRSGRMFRHDLPFRHQHQKPVLYIAGLTELPSIALWEKQLYWSLVYDGYILLKTWAWLKTQQTVCLPHGLEDAVEAIYADDSTVDMLQTPALQELETAHWGKHLAVQHTQRLQAELAHIGHPQTDDWREVPPVEKKDIEDDPMANPRFQAKTRLGEASVTMILLEETPEGIFCGGQPLQFNVPPDLDTAKHLYAYSLNLGKKALVKWCQSPDQWSPQVQAIRQSWEQTALLKNCYPLLLQNQQAVIDKVLVCWDAQLGLVYKNTQHMGEAA